MVRSNISFTGNGNTPLHYQCSNDRVNINSSVEVLDYNTNIITPNTWTLLYVTFKPIGKYWRPLLYFGTSPLVAFNVAYLKLEEGNKATAWLPAYEDQTAYTDNVVAPIATRLTTAESNLTQTAEDITFGFSRMGVDGYTPTGKTVVDETGLTVYDGGIRIKNNVGTNVLSADANGNLILHWECKCHFFYRQ